MFERRQLGKYFSPSVNGAAAFDPRANHWSILASPAITRQKRILISD